MVKVLKRLHQQGLLAHLIVAGSWCLYFYKFYYNKRQPKRDKRARDIEQITRILNLIQKQNQTDVLVEVYCKLHRKWQGKIISNLNEIGQDGIAAVLEARMPETFVRTVSKKSTS